MAKGKSLNPADAQRKAERKKELKKNKTERQKTRDFALVKKDTTDIEDEIQRLEKAGKYETDGVISASQKNQLSSLRTELARINKKKEEYIAEHPEHRKLVFRARYKKAEQETEGKEGENKKKERKVFNKNGIPRHPERSVYYDPVMNPFGVPPPGMPYLERPLRADEVDSQAEDGSDEDEDDEIPMPPGPPPAGPINDTEEDSDDDIPMPEGPPLSTLPPLPPLPPSPPPLPAASLPQPSTYNLPPGVSRLPPPAPPGFPAGPPMGFPSFPPNSSTYPLPHPPPGLPIPPPPPGFDRHPPGRSFHPPSSRLQSHGSMQDPLTSVPHQTFQAFRADHISLTHPLPDKPILDATADESPSATGRTQPASSAETGTISAPAQLRDLKKESTAFVPSSLKRKKTGGATNTSGKSSASRINAAPEASYGDKNSESEAARPDLLGALRTKLPAPITKTGTDEAARKKRKLEPQQIKKGKDDYEKFMEEIGDILGT